MSVISLKHHLKRGTELPPYLGIKGNTVAEDCFALGTKVMRWSEDIVLIDLKNVMNYWKWSAAGEELLPYFEKLLIKIFGEQKFCFGHHPFQTVLALGYQDEVFCCLGTPQGDLFFRQQTWDHWKSSLLELKNHIKKSEQAELGRAIGKWERFLERMKISRPFEILSIKQDSLERRFGKWIGRVWDWTFRNFRMGVEVAEQGDLFQTNFGMVEISFPWHGIEQKEQPQVKRFLEFPLLDWDPMVELLKEDMHKLLKENRELKNQRVTKMNWVVTLENLEEHSCSIIFRNPHSLVDDAPDFETTLFQAYYSYLSMMKKIEEREDSLDFPIKMATMGWRITVTESMRVAHKNEDMLSGSVSSVRLDMENKLPLSLESFGLKPSFFPETSYGHQNEDYLGEKLPWLAGAKRKPLFVFRNIEPLVLEGNYKRTFLERVSCLWWQGANPEMGERDYYLIEDEKGIMWWAYQDPMGGWYKHGLFS